MVGMDRLDGCVQSTEGYELEERTCTNVSFEFDKFYNSKSAMRVDI